MAEHIDVWESVADAMIALCWEKYNESISAEQQKINIALLSVIWHAFFNGPKESISNITSWIIYSVKDGYSSLFHINIMIEWLSDELSWFLNNGINPDISVLRTLIHNILLYSIPNIPWILENLSIVFQSTLWITQEDLIEITWYNKEKFLEKIDIETAQWVLNNMLEYIDNLQKKESTKDF